LSVCPEGRCLGPGRRGRLRRLLVGRFSFAMGASPERGVLRRCGNCSIIVQRRRHVRSEGNRAWIFSEGRAGPVMPRSTMRTGAITDPARLFAAKKKPPATGKQRTGLSAMGPSPEPRQRRTAGRCPAPRRRPPGQEGLLPQATVTGPARRLPPRSQRQQPPPEHTPCKGGSRQRPGAPCNLDEKNPGALGAAAEHFAGASPPTRAPGRPSSGGIGWD